MILTDGFQLQVCHPRWCTKISALFIFFETHNRKGLLVGSEGNSHYLFMIVLA